MEKIKIENSYIFSIKIHLHENKTGLNTAFDPPPQGYQQYQGFQQNQISGLSYVRKFEDEEVYAVNGFLALSFNRDFNAWRNQTILDLNTSLLSRIMYDYPSDSGFIAQKSETGWMVAGLSADSIAISRYLTGIAMQRSADFTEGLSSVIAPDYQLTFEDENMSPVQVNAYNQPDGSFLINSSSNPSSWFSSEKEGVFSDLFIPLAKLLGTD